MFGRHDVWDGALVEIIKEYDTLPGYLECKLIADVLPVKAKAGAVAGFRKENLRIEDEFDLLWKKQL